MCNLRLNFVKFTRGEGELLACDDVLASVDHLLLLHVVKLLG